MVENREVFRECLLPAYGLLSRGCLDGKMKLMLFVYSSVCIRTGYRLGSREIGVRFPRGTRDLYVYLFHNINYTIHFHIVPE